MANEPKSRRDEIFLMLQGEIRIRQRDFQRIHKEGQKDRGEAVVTATVIEEKDGDIFGEKAPPLRTSVRVAAPEEDVTAFVATDLDRFRAALLRHEEGRYGNCFECGGEIDLARLKGLPFANYCKKCEDERELKEQRAVTEDRLSRRTPLRFKRTI